MIVFTYSGQGSQKPAMGAPWVDHPSWELVEEAASIAQRDVAHLLLHASAEELQETHNAQLATYLMSMMVLDAVERVGVDAAGHAGHSLGEFSALTASGALDFADGVRLVIERGEAMRQAIEDQEGSMAVVLGLKDAPVEEACAAVDEPVWVANYNAPGQVVIAGSPSGVAAAGQEAKDRGAKRITPLAVAGAFHTPLMDGARQRLSAAIDNTEIRPPEGTVVANVDATVHQSPETWRVLMNAQLCSPVRWHQSLATLESAGFTTFIELGPGTVLTGLVKRTIKEATRRSVNTPDHLDLLLEALAGPQASSSEQEGEHLYATERLVVSPAAGVFTPVSGRELGSPVQAGDLLGHVGQEEVRSSFAGKLQGWLAVDTERVSASQPIAWLIVEQ